MRHGNHDVYPGIGMDPVDLLWEYSFAVESRRRDVEVLVNDESGHLDSIDTSTASMHERQALEEKRLQLADLYKELVGMRGLEAAALDMLRRVEAGEVSGEEIMGFVPKSFIEELLAERHEPEGADHKSETSPWLSAPELLGPHRYIYPYGFDYLMGQGEGQGKRLTTGRNRTSLNATTSRMSGHEAVEGFFEVTADTHGGKVRKIGKDGKTYRSKSGKRIRKY